MQKNNCYKFSKNNQRIKKLIFFTLFFSFCNSSQESYNLENYKQAWCLRWSENSFVIANNLNKLDNQDSKIRIYYSGIKYNNWARSYEAAVSVVLNEQSKDKMYDELPMNTEGKINLASISEFSKRIVELNDDEVISVCNVWYESTKGSNFYD